MMPGRLFNLALRRTTHIANDVGGQKKRQAEQLIVLHAGAAEEVDIHL